MRQQPEHAVFDHAAAPGDAEDLVVMCEPGAVEPPAQRSDDRRPARRFGTFVGHRETQRRDRLDRQPYCAQPIIAADLDDEPGDGRMQMDMLVPVHVIEHEAGGAEGLELGANLGGELPPGGRGEIKAEAGAHHVRIKRAVGADQRRHLRRRQQRYAVRQHQMQADTERG